MQSRAAFGMGGQGNMGDAQPYTEVNPNRQSPPTRMGPEPSPLGTPHLAAPRLLTAQENRAGRELAMDDHLRGLADCGPDAADIGKFAAFA